MQAAFGTAMAIAAVNQQSLFTAFAFVVGVFDPGAAQTFDSGIPQAGAAAEAGTVAREEATGLFRPSAQKIMAALAAGKWLRGSDRNVGRIPRQVGDEMRGIRFSSFNAFRRRFWRIVAKTPELSAQFSNVDLGLMRWGKPPRVRLDQALGQLQGYELHHLNPIAQGGGVYDLNNIVVASPRFHRLALH